MTELLLGIHCHQPYNNFFEIVKKATEKSYLPFLKTLKNFPDIKVSVHFSGWLFEWIKNYEKELFQIIKKLVEKEQIELFTAGFYEPILSIIPEEDVYLQIEKLNKFIKDNFGVIPDGLWLTERVWDSKIVKTLVECGIKYVIVDDYHFISAGFDKNNLQGYFLTEENGYELGIFPISKDLRYAIPFKNVDEVIDFITTFNTAIIFDDGEKFGWWPYTYQWVYEKNWLENFFDKVSKSSNIKTCLYRKYYSHNYPLGRVYLPNASYFEMGEWSLDYNSGKDFQNYYTKLKDEFNINENILQKFFKGGIWKNFLIKYEEANNIHKKMLKISKSLKKKALDDEKTEWLLKAECNDCLWHGVFGGIYLPNLRDNSYIALNNLEKLLNLPSENYFDFNCDGYNELELRNEDLIIGISEKHGAQVFEISCLNSKYNILNTLTRRKELYHDEILNSEPVEEDLKNDEIKTIHEIKYVVTKDIKESLQFDNYLKYAFIDLITSKDLEQNIADFTENFNFNRNDKCFEKTGKIKIFNSELPVFMRKKYKLDGNILKCFYFLKNLFPVYFDLKHIIEINLYFPGAKKEESFIEVNDRKINFFENIDNSDISEFKIYDIVLSKYVVISSSKKFNFICSPIITISKNEKEYEKTYQGTTFKLIFPFDLVYNEERNFTIELKLE